MAQFHICMTTIQEPTASAIRLAEKAAELDGRLVVAGDKKGPAHYELSNTLFLSLDRQLEIGGDFAHMLPIAHYARKNLAYLEAIREGAACIFETDDDNYPVDNWTFLPEVPQGTQRPSGSDGTARWINTYRYFTKDHAIWPRGLPLDEVAEVPPTLEPVADAAVCSPIQQLLVDGSPDVDAVWRLTQDRPFQFDANPPVYLGEGEWCPFNTQATWFWPAAYALLYVPSYCSFRMCDIWKSFVAQRCLWAFGAGVTFHAPQVVQERNPHDLMRDFEHEVPGYMQNRQIAEVLSALELDPNPHAVGENLRTCYCALHEAGIFPSEELPLVDLWLESLQITHG